MKFEDFLIQAHEDRLTELSFTPEYIKEQIKQIRSPGGIQILLSWPKDYIRETWKKAFDQVRHDTDGINHVFFSMHSIYYQTQNREFFTAYASDALSEFAVDKVITLVDDIYDCHARLRVDNGVMSDSSRERVFPDPHERARARINDLFTILDWRSKEMIAAEQIASILHKKHYVISVKHPLLVITSILEHDSIAVVYVSHPITQVRRLMKSKRSDEANAIKSQIAELIKELINGKEDIVTAVFPTSVDELIIQKEEGSAICAPVLDERWPLMFECDKLMYVKPELLPQNPLDIEGTYYGADGSLKLDALDKDLYAVSTLINDVLRPTIANHIDSRDHYLVDQCDAICVFRPYFDGNYSTGVSEEIEHRTTRFRCGIDNIPKPCIVYCPPDDLAKVRLLYLLELVEEETSTKFSTADVTKMIETARNDSQTWFRLRNLQPEDWEGEQVKKLFQNAGLKVQLAGKIEKGALGKTPGLQHMTQDYEFWNEILSRVVDDCFDSILKFSSYAASFISPSTNLTPSMTLVMSLWALIRR
ncbi:MAG: hypothetical protein KKH67_06365, partial [candidate division Zixibacteria bacterium]|nr:hypothetical protein [candidate division Zixibacteria bacterium]